MLLLDYFVLLLQQTNVSYQTNSHNSAQNWRFTEKWKNKNMISSERIDSESFESKHGFLLQNREIENQNASMKQKVKVQNKQLSGHCVNLWKIKISCIKTLVEK